MLRLDYRRSYRAPFFLATLADGTAFADAMDVPAITSGAHAQGHSGLFSEPIFETVKLRSMSQNARVFGLTYPNIKPSALRSARGTELGLKPYALRIPMRGGQGSRFCERPDRVKLRKRSGGTALKLPCVIFTSGELVVTVGSHGAWEGATRNTAWRRLPRSPGRRIVVGAVDTDGTDSPDGLKLSGAPDCLAGRSSTDIPWKRPWKNGIDICYHVLDTHAASEPL